MYGGIGMSASSLHRESTDSLIVINPPPQLYIPSLHTLHVCLLVYVSKYTVYIQLKISIIPVDTLQCGVLKIPFKLTSLRTRPALWSRADLMAWRKSTTPSVFSRSIWEWMVRKVPVRLIPSLQKRNEDSIKLDIQAQY